MVKFGNGKYFLKLWKHFMTRPTPKSRFVQIVVIFTLFWTNKCLKPRQKNDPVMIAKGATAFSEYQIHIARLSQANGWKRTTQNNQWEENQRPLLNGTLRRLYWVFHIQNFDCTRFRNTGHIFSNAWWEIDETLKFGHASPRSHNRPTITMHSIPPASSDFWQGVASLHRFSRCSTLPGTSVHHRTNERMTEHWFFPHVGPLQRARDFFRWNIDFSTSALSNT